MIDDTFADLFCWIIDILGKASDKMEEVDYDSVSQN